MKRGRPVVQYLVKWLGYSNAYNQWYDLDDLGEAMETVRAYDDAYPLGELGPTATASRAPRSVMRQPPRRAGLQATRTNDDVHLQEDIGSQAASSRDPSPEIRQPPRREGLRLRRNPVQGL